MKEKKLICRLPILLGEYNVQMSTEGREKDRLTLRELAQEIGVAHTTITRLNKGGFARVDVETIEKVCMFFDCELQDLLVLKDVSSEGGNV